MKKLEKLTQNEFGELFFSDDREISTNVSKRGKIKTLVVEHPCLEISNVITEMFNKKSNFIPERTNAYITSDFSAETQHLKENKKFYSVYAIQFYYVYGLNI